MSNEVIQSLINGIFVISGVIVGACIPELRFIFDRRRKIKEEKNKTISCLLSLYFYVSHLCGEEPLQEVIESSVNELRKQTENTIEIMNGFEKVFLPSRSKSMQNYLNEGVESLKQRMKDAVDFLSARDPLLAYSLDAKIHILAIANLAENYTEECIGKYAQLRKINISPDYIDQLQRKTKRDVLSDVLGSIEENLYVVAGGKKFKKKIAQQLHDIQPQKEVSEIQKKLIKDLVKNFIEQNFS
jgi:hypothetical protein